MYTQAKFQNVSKVSKRRLWIQNDSTANLLQNSKNLPYLVDIFQSNVQELTLTAY